MSYFLKLAFTGDIENIVASVVQIIASAAYGTQGGIAGNDAR
jgi:hypothetical protein